MKLMRWLTAKDFSLLDMLAYVIAFKTSLAHNFWYYAIFVIIWAAISYNLYDKFHGEKHNG
jgi:hypothetical protein